MKILRFFKCSNDHITERLVESSITLTVCEECKEEAKKVLAAPKYFGNGAGGRSPSC